MAVVTAREEGPSSEEFSKNAAHRPDVNCFGVHLERQHYFWCTIPPSCNIFRHKANFLASRNTGLNAPGQAKVADLEIAVGIQKQICRLEIAMNNICTVNRLQGA